MGRPKTVLELTDDERSALIRITRRRTISAAIVLRAKIVLKCATGAENQHVTEALSVSQNTVGKWRRRFIEKRLDGVVDEPRVGRHRQDDSHSEGLGQVDYLVPVGFGALGRRRGMNATNTWIRLIIIPGSSTNSRTMR